ncbi:CDP-alcohol phosphatidyltransferase [Candidatus Moduliflexus flocculans]|uniref:CDP-alcohol phosphatidyltransferase n=1 Tax=Candidatus Moduliflexus flocculans TaxID=1499966 RepID=A0A0S6W516_9BACT|nr:CDP-alcohol phosphatidyltransferase [Candidatus Moduliflexus flocculans]
MTVDMAGKAIGKYGSQARDAIARAIVNSGISPNLLTATGVLINLFAGVLLAIGVTSAPGAINWWHVTAGAVIFIANAFDVLDGAVARMAGRVTKFGAFFDSVTDRYSDMMLFAGAITYFALRHDLPFVVISAVALVGSVMTSYTRARAESLFPGRFDAGYMERPERIVAILVSCLLSRLYGGMLCIAVFSNLATFHRIWDARQIGVNLEHPESARIGYGSPNSFWLIRGLRSLVFWTYPRQTWQHDVLSLALFLIVIVSPIR